MGYTTVFTGRFNLNKKLDEETFNFLNKLANTRRVKRDVNKLKKMGYNGNYGIEGEFFVEGTGFMGQDDDESVIDGNRPPITQPGLWLQWIPTEDKMGLEWDQGEKFYEAETWIEYLINKILEPNGYIVNGIVNAQGEDSGDKYNITVINNKVLTNGGFSKSASKPSFNKWYKSAYDIDLD
jgi:hypothetical protein